MLPAELTQAIGGQGIGDVGLRCRVGLLLPINRSSGRGEDDFSHSVLDRLLQHIQRAKNIDLRVKHRILHGLPHVHLRCQMHDDVRPFVAKDPFQAPALNIQLVKTGGPIDVSALSGGEIVDDDGLMSFLYKPIGQMRSNESCSASHQYFHSSPHRVGIFTLRRIDYTLTLKAHKDFSIPLSPLHR